MIEYSLNFRPKGHKISLSMLIGRQGVIERVGDQPLLVLLVFGQQQLFVFLRVVEAIMLQFYVLQE